MTLSSAAVVAALLVLGPRVVVAQQVDVLHNFAGDPLPLGSRSLLVAQDGQLYGTSESGGLYGAGTIFTMTPSGSVTLVHSFAGGSGGSVPESLIQSSDGRFYGTTVYGGAFGWGTAFRMETDGTVVTLHSFGTPDSPAFPTRIILATDGRLYGNSYDYLDPSGAQNYRGAIFRMTTEGEDFTTLHAFTSTDGVGYAGHFNEASDGSFVGTSAFGMSGNGGVFRMTADGTVAVLHVFTGGSADGTRPWAGVIEAADGNFYGTTRLGGAFDKGTAFRMTPAGVVTVLHAFTGDLDGSEPIAPLLQAANGDFYGTASSNLPYAGTGSVFKVTSAGGFGLVHPFTGAPDGARPNGGLVQAANGLLHGTTPAGGIEGNGIVFSIASGDGFSVVQRFNVAGPDARLAQATDGQFYGARCGGGSHGHGELFRVSRTGEFARLYSFQGSLDGVCPKGLVQASDGLLYGTAAMGGPFDGGTIYRIGLDGSFTLLHAFGTGIDGRQPMAPLIQAADGHLYGTTLAGGPSGLGTVFRMTLAGVVTVVHGFLGGVNGESPGFGLFQAADGMLYGVTGPAYGVGWGALFRLTLSGTFAIVHSFGFAEVQPSAPLVEGAGHNLYGVGTRSIFATPHNASWCAVFFRVSPEGTFTQLSSDYARCAGWHEGSPYAVPLYTLTAKKNGLLMGTESLAQSASILQFDPAGAIDAIRALSESEGRNIVGPMIEGTDGDLYGVAKAAGAFAKGTAFRVRLTLDPPGSVSVSAAGPYVRLAWGSVAGAVGYTVKRSSASGAETVLASNIVATEYSDTAVVRGETYYYVVTPINAFGEGQASYEVSMTPGRAIAGDFDGDGKADIGVYRPSTGVWYVRQSNNGALAAMTWGESTDVPVPGDYDGDGTIDAAIFRPSTGMWYIRPSSTFVMMSIAWGVSTDIPVPGDYDGDGRTDAAIFRPSTGAWFIRQSRTFTLLSIQWGASIDTPVPGDYDGDGKTDVAVFRASTGIWYARRSSTFTMATWALGGATDAPVGADYDGDGKLDVAVFRPSAHAWDLVQSGPATTATITWGDPSDVPVPADYDGDGRTDVAIFRPSSGVWYIRISSDGTMMSGAWGGPSDVPILKRP